MKISWINEKEFCGERWTVFNDSVVWKETCFDCDFFAFVGNLNELNERKGLFGPHM